MKKNFLIIDTESNNSICNPEVYDIGYVIIDSDDFCTVLKNRGFLVQGVSVPAHKNLLYAADMAYTTATLREIRDQIAEDIADYNVGYIGGYNTTYDMRVLKNTYLQDLLPADTPKFCIWSIACKTILCQQEFANYIIKNSCWTSNHTPKTTLDVVYNYVADTPMPIPQKHVALTDALWTAVILKECVIASSEENAFTTDINPFCWKQVAERWNPRTEPTKGEKKAEENLLIESEILSVLRAVAENKKPVTASDVRAMSEVLCQYSLQKIAAVLLKMAKKDKKITWICNELKKRPTMMYML